jgi:CMP-N-acetylneuraminic acid synthetase
LYKNKKILAVILARSASKRLKNKNILNFFGKPLFYWTLLAAKKSQYLDNIIISTNDKKIINYTKKVSYVKTINRTEKLSGDSISSEYVLLDLISKLKEK